MKIISGEAIQDLTGVSISKLEHKKFESANADNSIDIDNFDFTDFDNPNRVYVNSSLINISKPDLIKSDLYGKLKQFKNPFNLILHNSDDPFDDVHLKYFDIPNIKKIFTQNINTVHERLFALPIGLANSIWEFGDKEYFKDQLLTKSTKTNSVYFNFTVKGGARDEYRPQCYEGAMWKKIPQAKPRDFKGYIEDIKTYKYCLSPEGNGIDCHRMWECLYLKVIPICHRNILTEHFAKLFPIVLVDDWRDDEELGMNVQYLESSYKILSDWRNYHLLDLDSYLKHINFYD